MRIFDRAAIKICDEREKRNGKATGEKYIELRQWNDKELHPKYAKRNRRSKRLRLQDQTMSQKYRTERRDGGTDNYSSGS